ncbi:MAG TPA: PucR family transcriptional regulator ligand-binding domain-containing protein [Solirubrobacter sp.]|nr:PucR family transcriptional regulator ligand-binding domain-containing protein [Solirubrobacter sp.]
MGITVGQLVSDPLLKTRIVAGAAGAGRLVSWAHACELDAPWEWLGQGDLVMTTGFAVPAAGDAQAVFVERLSAEGLAGIAIGENMNAPPLTAAMLEAADRCAFPLLMTAYEVPWVALSRAVVRANQREEREQLSRMVRMYDRVRRAAIEGHDAVRLIDDLAAELGSELHVVGFDGTTTFRGAAAPPEPLLAELRRQLAARDMRPPAVLRLRGGAQTTLAVPVPAGRSALLLVTPRGAEPPLALLQHVATMVALEVEKLMADREHRRRIGSELLASILEGRVEDAVAASQLEMHGLRPDTLVLVALERSSPMVRSDLHSRLADRGIAHVLLRRGETVLIALDAGGGAVADLVEVAGHDAYVGVSTQPIAGPARIPDAVREARLAVRAARSGERRVVRYGENDEPFMPRTVAEANSVVNRVLGPLIEYDREHGADLVHSLEQFLEANRSWRRAAETLFVHKQTLVYRMKRVEELTGRRLDDTGDVAELWLALQALKLVG